LLIFNHPAVVNRLQRQRFAWLEICLMNAALSSTVCVAEETALETPLDRLQRSPLLWTGIVLAAVAGCLGIFSDLADLWFTWTTDPLRSIGMLIVPAAIVLTLRAWRQSEWELQGTWWGLPVVALAYLISIVHRKVVFLEVIGGQWFSILPISFSVYLYGCGVILLFAGPRVWRRAWFPLGLLLLAQPVPGLINPMIDLPLQNLSARIARWFATAIGFAPTTPQLRLMFAPDFGMFIAPGCDGIRGAVTMGYVALVTGYLKRLRFLRWAGYVAGGVLLGYLFNFTRLCVLVLYYRAALGHRELEDAAKQADYVIGGCLYLVATWLFLWVIRRKEKESEPEIAAPAAVGRANLRAIARKCEGFALVLLAALAVPTSAIRAAARQSTPTPAILAARMPRQIGKFALSRTWYEQNYGTIKVESGAYSVPQSDEVIFGVWVAPGFHIHDSNQCWMSRGLQSDLLTSRVLTTAGGKSVEFDEGFYSDGITDSVVLNAACTETSCLQASNISPVGRAGLVSIGQRVNPFSASGGRPVSLMIRIDRLHSDRPKAANYQLLAGEAQQFVEGFDPFSMSRAFQ
jgi:exosortase J